MKYEIKPKKKFSFGMDELVEYKELFYFFTWRDIKVKYKQTFLGVFWAILQPVFMTLVFSYTIGKSITQNSKIEIPYILFVLTGMLIWGVFSSGLTNSSNSMVVNANIRIYYR